MLTSTLGYSVNLSQEASTRKLAFSDPCWEKAGELLEARGIPQQDHVLLQENVATYLANGAEKTGYRFNLKMVRDLDHPYRDQDVFGHVDELQKSLMDNLAAIPVIPHHVYVNGSFARGRLGVNSDLDTLVALEPKDRDADLKPLQKLASDTGATVFPMFTDDTNYNRTVFILTGSSRKVDVQELQDPHFLKKKYAQELEQRGIVTDPQAGCTKVAPSKDRKEINPTFEKVMGVVWKEGKSVEDKWDSLFSNSLKARTFRTAFRVCGAMCGLPLVGGVFGKIADFCIKQDHS